MQKKQKFSKHSKTQRYRKN